MKRILSILVFLVTSSLYLSQSTSTSLTKGQVSEVYKGLVQGDYLKERLYKTEVSLYRLEGVSKEQDQIIIKQQGIISRQEGMIKGLEFQVKKEVELREVEIQKLKDIAEVNAKEARKTARKKYIKGIATGAVGTVVAGIVTLILVK